MNKFKVGDRVKVVKAAETAGCNWNEEMDKYIGEEHVINKVHDPYDPQSSYDYYLNNVTDEYGIHWYFPEESLEFVKEKS